MIVFADLHLKEESEKTVFEQVFPGLFAAVSHDPDKVLVCLGDFFHLRYRIPVHLQNKVLEFLETLERAGIKMLFLPGNHDQINLLGENALEVFRRFPNVTVFTQPQWNEYGYWIPYRKKAEDIAAALELGHRSMEGKPPVLWMHHGIRGAFMNNRVQDTKSLPVDSFRKWVVLCCHYHIRQQLGTVRYIGSPYQTKADETGQDKGYAIWNPVTLQLQWVNMDWGKRYHNLGVVAGEIDLANVRPGDEVRGTIPDGMDTTQLVKSLEQVGATFVLTPQLEVNKARLPVKSSGDFEDYVRAYVDQFGSSLDKDKLISIYKGMCE